MDLKESSNLSTEPELQYDIFIRKKIDLDVASASYRSLHLQQFGRVISVIIFSRLASL
jgi:hypothetical protein